MSGHWLQVVGIWFYDKQECSKVVALLEGIATDARKIGASLSPGPTPKPTGASQKSHPLLAAMQRKAVRCPTAFRSFYSSPL